MPRPIAYLPLITYPEAAPDVAILAAAGLAAALGCDLQVATFGVEIPPTVSPVGGLLIDIEGMARTAEARSEAECKRLHTLLGGAARWIETHRPALGAAADMATEAARRHDLVLIPWAGGTQAAPDLAQAMVFGAGVPVILVPAGAEVTKPGQIAIAWDGGRAAARALHDALPLLAEGGRITVLTVQGEKALRGADPAQGLAEALQRRGHDARAVTLSLEGRPIATALQEAALAEGALLLAMGGFGHSRLRDFILGGATKGVLADLRLPVLLSH